MLSTASQDPIQVHVVLPPASKKEPKTSRINNTDYCKCNHCKPMKTSVESVCCTEKKIDDHIIAGKKIVVAEHIS